jgi:hypothetical protein
MMMWEENDQRPRGSGQIHVDGGGFSIKGTVARNRGNGAQRLEQKSHRGCRIEMVTVDGVGAVEEVARCSWVENCNIMAERKVVLLFMYMHVCIFQPR